MKFRKLIPLFMACAMFGGIFAGCASNGGSSSNSNSSTGSGNSNSSTGSGSGTGDNGNGSGTTETLSALPAGNKIYVVGDSTVCEFYNKDTTDPSDNYYLPRYGYGTQISQYINCTDDQVVNLALSGRSSKSFLTEGNYSTLTTNIKAGDYLVIGFGHNDEKSDEAARFTDPAGSKDTETTSKGTSFKWCLYEKYVKVAKDKGATPILCTPITRYDASGSYTGAKVHVTADGDYNAAIKALGSETETTVIDLCTLTSEEYKKDNEAAKYYHAHTTYSSTKKNPPYDGTEVPDGKDDTHINKFGAKMVAYQFANALGSTTNSLKNHVRESIAAPTKADSYVDAIKQTYIKPDYQAPDVSTLTKLATVGGADWYKSAFGVLGGDSKVANYSMTYASDKFTITADTGSKFAGSQDGMGAIFTQIDISKNFTASVKAKIVSAPSSLNAQNAFGLMLRDDMLVDKNDSTLNTNFVAASVNGNKQAIFSRSSASALTQSGKSVSSVANGDTYELTITRVGQTVDVTVKFGSEVLTQKYTDFDFVARDNGYFYLCMFASRSFKVEFSELSYTVTGTSQGA